MRSKMIAAFILCATVYVTGCATYAPVAWYGEPEAGADRTVWLAYYREQFRTYGNSTLQPRSDGPDAARQGYMQARTEWKNYETNTAIAAGVLAAAAVVALAAYIGSM